jgi:predicted alpha/beta-fold hydrolase
MLKAGHALEDNWFTRHVYSKSLTVGLKKIVCDHIDTIVQFPDSRFAQALPTLMSLSLPTMFQFDSLISVHSAASSPFDDAWAYYAYSSSHDKLDGVRIPFLALNSHDDPIAQCVPQDYKADEQCVELSPRHSPLLGDKAFAEVQAYGFCCCYSQSLLISSS